jgi:hypothetical protein
MQWTCHEASAALARSAHSVVRILSIELKCTALNWDRANVRW